LFDADWESMDQVAKIVDMLVLPTLFFATVAFGPRWFDAVRCAIDQRNAEAYPQPTNEPIERIAANLRRLLWEHHRILRSNDYPMRALRVAALEGAISLCAAQAARGLDIPCPAPPDDGRFHRPELRRLLRVLAAEGLVLPLAVELLSGRSS
jgi:hypothetical protein